MFDTLITTATDLQALLLSGKITSVQIVKEYLAQIDRHNAKLNAFISIAPRESLLRVAAELDGERHRGGIRSQLHGIPIVLKDCFVTASCLGMDTTAGSLAFVGAKARDNGAIVQKLIDAGLIILGKTNMTEFCGMKMINSPGRSAAGGQTLSPYVGDIEENEVILGHSSPGGSSTGSAVAVAAGFSPFALGTETIGSLVTPTARAALFTIKPTVGSQNCEGMYKMTDFFDSPGPMAKSPVDLVSLFEILLNQNLGHLVPGHCDWTDLSIGFLSPTIWKLVPEMCKQHEGTAEQMAQDYERTVSLLRSQGCNIKYPIELPDAENLTVDGEAAIMPVAFWEFREVGIPSFIDSFEECGVTNLEDIIKFNEENKENALPPGESDQDLLIEALNSSASTEHITHLGNNLREKAKGILREVFDREQINMIAAPTDSALAVYAASAGYPIGNVPLGQLKYNQRPFGLCLIAEAHEEEKILQFMMAYETATDPRPTPHLPRE
ncbi:amidase signature domain-containing protein [Truncatella angustata]|uniref:Amidase signature domain-containing protein n=1 Tax=Truncatella angustata TaxID=152316 RepID=A0A9P8ZVW2_9PEZI|nr:amidase signature domain-containing protein [Truncatella angustata]KAH6652410.1 amidase signature domain-containing protein [Truncatella angustata]